VTGFLSCSFLHKLFARSIARDHSGRIDVKHLRFHNRFRNIVPTSYFIPTDNLYKILKIIITNLREKDNNNAFHSKLQRSIVLSDKIVDEQQQLLPIVFQGPWRQTVVKKQQQHQQGASGRFVRWKGQSRDIRFERRRHVCRIHVRRYTEEEEAKESIQFSEQGGN